MRVELPVAGLFRVRDGAITLWRDYFDMRTFETQMAGG
jgi:limonene-1,2-epoxide hydrolase